MALHLDARLDAVRVIDAQGEEYLYGQPQGVYPWASVTKLLTALVVGDIVSSGFVSFDDPVDHPRFLHGEVTLKDLLSHVSGLSTDPSRDIAPRTKRIYTNEAFDIADDYISMRVRGEVGETSIRELFHDGLRDHLESTIEMRGSCATSSWGNFDDLCSLLREIRKPRFVGEEMHALLIAPYCTDMSGIVPGWGNYEHNTFGIGFEVKGDKHPHWMGPASGNAYGHFGQSGTFVFHDPDVSISIACVTNVAFGPWAKEVYPALCREIYEMHTH